MRTREKCKGRANTGGFQQLPKDLINHPNFFKLRHRSKALLIDLLSQYNGKNNGDLCAAMTLMKERGWTSNSSLNLALKELQYYGFIKIARQGGRNLATLYAVTFKAVDDCGGKIDINPTRVPSFEYKATKKKWQPH
ncbi:hypothetical protein N9137_02345 [Pseudomonadales bacterium]|nr:hypothetical protein [Pseudomonadales bacterium]